MPLLYEFYPGICLTTEEKARKNLSQGKKNLCQSTVYILPKHPHITTSPPSHTHTHTHTHTLLHHKRTRTSLLCLCRETNRCLSIQFTLQRRTSAQQSKHVNIYHPLTSHHNFVLECSCSQTSKETICQSKLIQSRTERHN